MDKSNTKIVTALAVLAVAVALLVGISKYKDSSFVYNAPSAKNQNVLTTTPKDKNILPPDTDGDGLFDWEEMLWKTDPTKTDTDGDGVSDGDEVEASENPLSDTKSIVPSKTVTSSNLSTTDIFSQQIFAKYLQEKNIGITPTIDDYQGILEEAFQSERTLSAPKQHTAEGLRVISDPVLTDYNSYSNGFGFAMLRKPSEKVEYELYVLKQAIDENNPAILEDLKNNIPVYERTIADLLKISVPEPLVPEHLDVLDSISIIKRSTEGMMYFFSDPVKSAAMMEGYPEATEKLIEALANIKAYLAIKGVVFKHGDIGYDFWSRI